MIREGAALKIVCSPGKRGLSVVAPTFGPIMWESLTNEDSAELLEEKLKGIQESRLGEHIGTVSQWHQVPMSHIGSFVVLNGLTGFGFSVSGMRWAAAVMQRMGEDWCLSFTEHLSSLQVRGDHLPIVFSTKDDPNKKKVREALGIFIWRYLVTPSFWMGPGTTPGF